MIADRENITTEEATTEESPTQSTKTWRILLGVLVFSHAYLHALPGMFATAWPLLPAWTSTGALLWAIAFGCLLSASFGLWGWPFFSLRWRQLAIYGAVASIILHFGAWQLWTWPGILADIALLTYAWRSEPLEIDAPKRKGWSLLGVGFVQFIALLLLVHGVAAIVVRPWQQHWGATPREIAQVWPSDDTSITRAHLIDHVVTVNAPPDKIWPWLVQVGQDKAGFYSYDWLERLVGDDIQNVHVIVPNFQHLKEGDLVRAVQPSYMGGLFGDQVGWRVKLIVPNRMIVLENWGTFWIEPDGPNRSRLGVRTEVGNVPFLAAPIEVFAFEPMHFTMEQRMLRTIKALAER